MVRDQSMPSQYTKGFSLQSYNRSKDFQNRRQEAEDAIENQEMVAAKSLLEQIESGKLITLNCDKDVLKIKFLKNLVRGDTRYAWNHHDNLVSFSTRKKPKNHETRTTKRLEN